MRVAFRSAYLGHRGTEVALYDYALEARGYLGIEPLILMPPKSSGEPAGVRARFEENFSCRECGNPGQLDGILQEEKCDVFYSLKNGHWDGWASDLVPTWVHAIFPEVQAHGTKYAFVSRWLSETWGYGEVPWVPHMIRPWEEEGDLRQELGIPAEAKVFGRHGGADSFDLPAAREAVRTVSEQHPEIHFIFLNTDPFLFPRPANVHHLEGTADRGRVGRFLRTCNAMVHGRTRGETFGMAIAEAGICGRPVFTWRHSPERNHLDWVTDECWRYSDAAELHAKLVHFQPGDAMDCSFAEEFSPANVMEKFREVFLR